ncbi:MAG: molybdenum cofactor guanylyltransferase [Rhodothermales bacterium]|nr:molybdenum cofactor guanylyltransferase [Rhodothermales bacterium]
MNKYISGLILAGGRSRRFGSDKAAHDIGGQAMIARAFDALSAVTDDVIVSVRYKDQRYELDAEHVADRYRGLGPLAGLDAGFRRTRHDWVFVLACDLPQISRSDIRRIAAHCTPDAEAVVAIDHDDRPQPLCACYYRPAAERHVKQLLQRRHLSMMGLLQRLDVVSVPLSEEALVNVNRRADLKMLSLL